MTPCIIVEGHDRSGKSTLIEAIKTKFPGPWVTFHNGRQPDDESSTAYAMYADQMELVERHKSHWFIFDRLHLSQAVYGALYRGDRDSLGLLSTFDREHVSPNALLIICERKWGTFEDDGESSWSRYETIPRVGHTAESEMFWIAAKNCNNQIMTMRGDPTKFHDEMMHVIGKYMEALNA